MRTVAPDRVLSAMRATTTAPTFRALIIEHAADSDAFESALHDLDALFATWPDHLRGEMCAALIGITISALNIARHPPSQGFCEACFVVDAGLIATGILEFWNPTSPSAQETLQ